MDANGLRSFLFCPDAAGHAWPADDGSLPVEPGCGKAIPGLRLASRAPRAALRETATQADAIVLRPAMAQDAPGNYAWWDADAGELRAVSAAARRHPGLEPVSIALPAEAQPVRDLAYTGDDRLLIAGGDGLWMLDTRARHALTRVDATAVGPFTAQRLCALRGDGAAALDATSGRIARIVGRPLSTTGVDRRRESDDRFQVRAPNPDPPRLQLLPALPADGARAVAIAGCADGALAVLRVAAGGGASLRFYRDGGGWSAALPLAGPRFPHTLGFIDDEQPALLTEAVALDAQDQPQPERDLGVFVYRLPAARRQALLDGREPDPAPQPPGGAFHPARDRLPGPFVQHAPGSGARLCYPRRASVGAIPEPAPVVRLAGARRSTQARIANFREQTVLTPLDSGAGATVWHRLFVEAELPPNTAMLVWLAAGDAARAPVFAEAPEARGGWHAHLFGDRRALPPAIEAALAGGTPQAHWLDQDSEVAGGVSLLAAPRRPAAAGLFGVLIQRAGHSQRALAGRRLWCVVELFGDGRATPELAALRAYAGRRSYRDRYLPALYRESLGGTAADARGAASAPDFLDRFISLFEGLFTDIEDRIAAAHLLSDARGCPDEALDWLAGWIGLALEPGLPKLRARWMIANAAALARRHGTLDGLQLALDIATDGAVTRGRIVVVEDWRLRRSFSAILGADLSDAQDPLTAGLSVSGNSIVGDSLFLGAEDAQELLALLRVLDAPPGEQPALSAAREQVFKALFDGLAWRVTVLVHETLDADELRLIARIAETAAPAHLRLRVVTARHPLLVSVAALVGADSYLRQTEPPSAVRLDHSRLGNEARLAGPGSLDPYAGVFGDLQTTPGALGRPTADARAPQTVELGRAFALDGSRSRASAGRRLAHFRWTRLPPRGEPPTPLS